MSYIYAPAKHRRSGSTMQKVPARSEIARRERITAVLPGYPWRGQFSSREEVDGYLSKDEVTCLLCGKFYRFLAGHLVRTHGIHPPAYKEQFGIPQTRGLSGAANRDAHARSAKERNIHLFLAGHEPKTPDGGYPNTTKPPQWLRKYNDFSWHLKIAESVVGCVRVKPPDGCAGWGAFDFRRKRDAVLNDAYQAARQKLRTRLQAETSYRRLGRFRLRDKIPPDAAATPLLKDPDHG